MANARTVTVTLKTVADVQDVLQNVKQIQGALNQLKMPETMATTFKRIFDNIEKNANKAGEVINNNFRGKSDVSKFEQSMGQINNLFLQLRRSVAQIPDNVISDSFTQDLKEVEALQKRVNELTDQYKARLSQIDVKALNDAKNAIAGISKSKAWDSFIQNLTSGNIEGATKDLEQLTKTQQRFNDETKRNEFGKSLDVFRTALNGLTTDNGFIELRKQLDEAGLAVQNITDTQLQALVNVIRGMPQQVDQLGQSVNTFATETSRAGQATNDLGASLDRFKSRAAYFLGLENAVRLFRRAVHSAFETVKDLDAVMTETAVVTEFSVGDMWSQLPEYTDRANALGVSIHSAYEAATLYYQQGLDTNEVVAVSTETLKMARIASLDAATATDRMTNALRGFNMTIDETNAKNINDVYSKLAAITASNVDEISTAMTKVASLANNANMSFENTSAFLAQIIETTRESAETAGTALKTVIARFSEVKELYGKNQLLGIDTEGEAVDVNKVSAALRTAGINLNEYLTGMKGLDQIFLELASKWDGLDQVQQRYIATMAAGSRQQSRFIALMSDYNRTQELVAAANNASGAAQEQFNKTLDSLESKLNKLKNAWDSFLMSVANNEVIKITVDLLTWLIEGVNKLTDGLPGLTSGLAKLGLVFGGMKLAKTALGAAFTKVGGLLSTSLQAGAKEGGQKGGTLFFSAFRANWNTNRQSGKDWFNSIFSLSDIEKGKQALIRSINDPKLDIFTSDQKHTITLTAQTEGYEAARQQILKMTAEQVNQRKITEDQAKQLEKVWANVGTYANKTRVNLGALGGALTGIGAAIAGIGSLLDQLGVDEEITKWVKGIGMIVSAAGGILMTVNMLGKAFPALGAKAAGAGLTAQAGWGWISLAVGAVIALIAGVIAIYKTLEAQTPEKRIEKLTKAVEESQEAATKAQDAYDSLMDQKSGYQTLIDQVQNLTKGTKEWRDAIYKVNQETLKLLALHGELAEAGYTSIDENGMITLSDAGWEYLLQEQQNQVRAAQRQVTLNSGNLLAAREEQLNKMRSRNVGTDRNIELEQQMLEAERQINNERYRFISQLVNDQYGGTKNYNQLVRLLSQSGIVNKQALESAGTQQNRQKQSSHEWLNVLGSTGIGAALFGPIGASIGSLIGNLAENYDVFAYSSELVQRMKEVDYKPIERLEDESEKDYAKRVESDLTAKEMQLGWNKILDKLVETGLFDGKLDVNLSPDAYSTFSQENANIKQLIDDQLAFIRDQRDAIDNQLYGYFEQDAESMFGSYDIAQGLLGNLDLLASSKGGDNLLKAILEVKDTAGSMNNFKQVIQDFSMINFDSAIAGATELNRWAKSDSKAYRQLAEAVLEANGELYNTTAQANELYKTLGSEQMEDLLKDGKIAADELREMAVEGSALKQVLDNTGISIHTLATYFDDLANGTLDAASATTNFVEILDDVLIVQNTIADTFALIENFDPGKSITEVHSFVEDVKEKFNELADLGAYSDDSIIAYEKLIFGEERFNQLLKISNGDMSALAETTKALLDSIGTNFYGLWQQFSNSVQGDAFSVGDNGQIDVDLTKVESIDQVLLDLQTNLGISHEMAQTMFTDLVNSSDKLKTGFDRLAAMEGFKEWIQTGQQFGNTIVYSEKELDIFAQRLGTTTEHLKDGLTDVFNQVGNGAQVAIENFLSTDGTLDKDSALFSSLADDLKNKLVTAIDEATEEGVDLAAQYEFLVNLGLDDQHARQTLGMLWDKASKNFGDTQFAFDPSTLQVAATNVDKLADHGEQKTKEGISQGIVDGQGEPKVQAAQELSALEYAKQLANSVATGATAALLAPLRMFEEYVRNNPFIQMVAGMFHVNLSGQSLSDQWMETAINLSTPAKNQARIDYLKKYLSTSSSVTTAPLLGAPASKQAMQTYFDNLDKETRNFFKDGSAYLTETARKIGEDVTEDAKDKAKEVKEAVISNLGLGDPLDELYNINQEIAAQLREQTKLEREYTVLTRDGNTTLQQMRDNYFAQIDNLAGRAQSEANRSATAKALLDQLDQRYFLINNELRSFADLGVSDLIKFDGNKIVKDIVGINSISDPDIRSAFDKYSSMFEAYVNEFISAEENLVDIQEQIEDFQRAAIDSYLSFEERVMDAYLKEKERELDKIEAMQDALNDAAADIIKKIQEQIQDARQARENEKTEQDLSDKSNRLAYLRRDTSGANALEIAQLEKELAESRQDYSDSLVDQAIERMQADADIAAEQRAMQISALRQIHEDMTMAGEYWPAVYNLMESAFTNGTLNYNSDLVALLKKSENFASLSTIGQQRWLDDATRAAIEAYPVLSQQVVDPAAQGIADATGRAIATSEQAIMSNSAQLIDDAKTHIDDIRTEIREGVLKAEDAARAAQETALEAAKAAAESAASSNESSQTVQSMENHSYQQLSSLQDQFLNALNRIAELEARIAELEAALRQQMSQIVQHSSNYAAMQVSAQLQGTGVGKMLQPQLTDTGLFSTQQSGMSRTAYHATTQQDILKSWIDAYASRSDITGLNKWAIQHNDEITAWGLGRYLNAVIDELKKRFAGSGSASGKPYLVKNAKGGMIDFTGPAWLDGTRTNPEAVLSAQDTRNFIALRDALASLTNNNVFGNSSSTGDAYYDIDINAEIGSDYDVDQLADRIKKQITDSAQYRNVHAMNLMR